MYLERLNLIIESKQVSDTLDLAKVVLCRYFPAVVFQIREDADLHHGNSYVPQVGIERTKNPAEMAGSGWFGCFAFAFVSLGLF